MRYKGLAAYRAAVAASDSAKVKKTVQRTDPSPYRSEKKKRRESEGIFRL